MKGKIPICMTDTYNFSLMLNNCGCCCCRPTIHRNIVEGSNNRFLPTPADGIPQSSRNPGPLVDW